MINNKVMQANRKENKKLYPYDVLGVANSKGKKNDVESWIKWHVAKNSFKLEQDFSSYLKLCSENATPPKIVVTYDSLPKIMGFIAKSDLFEVADFNLLVDEYHMLFTEYLYRGAAVRNALERYKEFGNYTFLTATPIEGRYNDIEKKVFLLEALKGIRIVEAVWEDYPKARVVVQECHADKEKNGSIKDTLHMAIKTCLSQDGYNLYIFVNSPTFIKAMISKNSLDSSNCRVICSPSNNTVFGGGIERGATLDDPKRINFLTSSAFEGADIWDPIGKTIIVSDPNLRYGSVDIFVKIPQIAGRIRDSKYSGEITYLLKKVPTETYGTVEEFARRQRYYIEKEEKQVAELKLMETIGGFEETVERTRDDLFNKVYGKAKYHYIHRATQEIVRDFDATKTEILAWVTLMTHEYGLTAYTDFADNGMEYCSPVVPMNINSFEDAIISLQVILKERGETSHEYTEQMRRICDKYKWFESALSVITLEEIEQMKYRQDHVKAYLEKRVPADKKAKLEIELRKIFRVGDVILCSYVKEKLTKIYSDFGILKVKSKATDLGEYFEIKNAAIRSNDKVVRAIEVVSHNTIRGKKQ